MSSIPPSAMMVRRALLRQGSLMATRPSAAGARWRSSAGSRRQRQGCRHVVLTKWLPGNMSHPHFHPNDRFITVIKGTWWVGTGTKFDPDSTVPMPAGTFVTHFGKQVHYDGAKAGTLEDVNAKAEIGVPSVGHCRMPFYRPKYSSAQLVLEYAPIPDRPESAQTPAHLLSPFDLRLGS